MSRLPDPSSPEQGLQLPQKQADALPSTPVRNEQDSNHSPTHEANDTKSPTPTIRERRGRRQYLPSGTFRPLSVFTRSLLVPFDLDTDKAFEILKGDSPDRFGAASTALNHDSSLDNSSYEQVADCTGEVKEKEKQEELYSPKTKLVTPQRPRSRAAMEAYASARSSQIDLITALKSTSPEKDSVIPTINADFATLCELPAPESSQHPAYSSDPFEANTELPLLYTSSSIDEIRLFNPKNNARHNSASKLGRDSIERKRGFFAFDLRTPSSARSRNAFSSSEETPLPITIPTPNTASTYNSIKSSSPLTMEFVTPKETFSSASTSSSMRKFSDLFRKKDSIERGPDSPSWSPRQSMDSPNLSRTDLEKYLRRTCNAPTYDYDPYSPYPRHPNTSRGWRSRNLKCTNCIEESCAVCCRVCCAFRAAVLALDNHLQGSPGRPTALQRIQEITKVFPYGKETPTFLQCTAGIEGDKAGCGKLVCPDCCSICPDEMCADTLCRKCKPAMWEECDWHKGDALMLYYQ